MHRKVKGLCFKLSNCSTYCLQALKAFKINFIYYSYEVQSLLTSLNHTLNMNNLGKFIIDDMNLLLAP